MKKTKKAKVIISIIVLISIIVFLGSMVFYKNRELLENEDSAITFSKVMKKLNNESETCNSVELNDKELNKILSSYIANGISKNGIKINKSYVKFIDKNINVYLDIEYKKIKFELSTKGNIYSDRDNLVFEPLQFKVGRIPLSKNFVIKTIRKYYKNVEKNKIFINKNKLPIKIDDVEFKDNKLVIELRKSITSQVVDKVKGELNCIVKETKDNSTKQKANKTIESINNIINKNNDDNNIEKHSNILVKDNELVENEQYKNSVIKDKGIDNSNTKSVHTNNMSLNTSLNKSLVELNNTKKMVYSQKQKQMMDIMISTAKKLKRDKTFDYGQNMTKVISIYRGLPPKDKKRFKELILTNVDITNALKVKNGL